MKNRKVVIVGGVAAGASCAARLRRLDEFADIVIIEKSNHVSYANCGMPYYIGKEITDASALIVQSPESLYKRFRIDVRCNSEVVAVDTVNKQITVRTAENEYQETYDYLVLCPGCHPRKLFGDLPSLRNVEDAFGIRHSVDEVESVGVIGGGFIGVELAENLAKSGKKVTLFEYADHILANLDNDIVSYLEDQMKVNGVELLTSSKITEAVKNDNGYVITLDNGDSYVFDYAVMAAGLEPSTGFLKDSGILLDKQGYIEVDQNMRTNIEGVYAGGDAVSVINLVTGKKAHIPLAGPANRQGRIIADNICGVDSVYEGSLSTSIIRVFDMVGASVGLNTAQIIKEYGKCETICTHPSSHASYYPGSSQLHIKIFYDKETRKIYGAQAVGREGVDKFIDVISTVMMLKGTVDDLAKLEQAYSPPFLSAKSPANYLGFVAQNEREGLEELVTVQQALKDGNVLLDVRTDREYSMGAFKNSIHIPVDELRNRLEELSPYKDRIIDVYCAVGVRGHIACRILKSYGFKVRNITGAYTTFKAMKL